MDYERLTAITREYVMPSIIDQIGKECTLLGKFLQKAKKGSGTEIHIPVKYRHNSQGGFYAGLELLDTAQETTRTRAVFQWKQVHKPIVISNIEKAKNMGKEGIIKLLSAEMDDAKSGLKDMLGTSLFSDGTGTDGKEIDGLCAAVDDGTNVATYGNINRTTYTWWQANYYGSLGTLTLAMMATAYDDCENGSKRPSIIVTTKDIWTDYEALNQSQIRFINSDGSGNQMDAGATKLAFRATPIEKDEYCPAGKMFMLNMDTFDYMYLPHPKYSTDNKGFAIRDFDEPINQDGEISYILSYINVVCKEPRANAQMDGIS